jgi:hypothetical protein
MAGSKNVKVAKEAFHIRVESSDGAVAFYNATDYVGKLMPFAKPKATCAMRVATEAVSFSLLHLTNKNASLVAAKPVSIPRGPLSRLERRAASYAPIALDEIIVELSTRPADDSSPSVDTAAVAAQVSPEAPVSALEDVFGNAPEIATETKESSAPKRYPMKPAVIETYKCKLVRDENNVARLESIGDEHSFELPKGALHVSLYLQSPVAAVARPLAVGFIGHVGKPGGSETVSRVVAMVLNSISHLPDFRILAQIEHCAVPANLSRGGGSPRAVRANADSKVSFNARVYLFDEQLSPMGAGIVGCEIDMENANPTSGKLLVSYHCEESLAGVFERYRAELDRAVANHLRLALGEDGITAITYDIVLGSVTPSTVEQLKAVGNSLPGLDISPTQSRPHID